MMNFGDPRLPQRFWDKCIPEPNSGCWLWFGAGAQVTGYGRYSVDGAVLLPHRVIAQHGETP